MTDTPDRHPRRPAFLAGLRCVPGRIVRFLWPPLGIVEQSAAPDDQARTTPLRLVPAPHVEPRPEMFEAGTVERAELEARQAARRSMVLMPWWPPADDPWPLPRHIHTFEAVGSAPADVEVIRSAQMLPRTTWEIHQGGELVETWPDTPEGRTHALVSAMHMAGWTDPTLWEVPALDVDRLRADLAADLDGLGTCGPCANDQHPECVAASTDVCRCYDQGHEVTW